MYFSTLSVLSALLVILKKKSYLLLQALSDDCLLRLCPFSDLLSPWTISCVICVSEVLILLCPLRTAVMCNELFCLHFELTTCRGVINLTHWQISNLSQDSLTRIQASSKIRYVSIEFWHSLFSYGDYICKKSSALSGRVKDCCELKVFSVTKEIRDIGIHISSGLAENVDAGDEWILRKISKGSGTSNSQVTVSFFLRWYRRQ